MRYTSKNSHLHSKQATPISNARKKNASNNKFSQQNKEFNKIMTAEGFKIPKWIKNCHF